MLLISGISKPGNDLTINGRTAYPKATIITAAPIIACINIHVKLSALVFTAVIVFFKIHSTIHHIKNDLDNRLGGK